MTGELERQDTVAGQVPLPGMPDPEPPGRVNDMDVTHTTQVSSVRPDARPA